MAAIELGIMAGEKVLLVAQAYVRSAGINRRGQPIS